MLESLLDWLFPLVLAIVFFVVAVLPEKEERRIEEYNELFGTPEDDYELCYDALRGLSNEEFDRVPDELKQKVPDKCKFCRWMLECDPLEMALATGEHCGGFRERRKTANDTSVEDSEKIL